ncbi:MAG: capsular polysaccharide synthesis protein [Lachnospiraceae bacterium]|nr:capsular polysaccharide synthesis protein [Lachnospiraceae bacterium]
MSDFKADFQKVGGVQKVKDFAREGVLGTVCGEILLLGKSHKALELVNLSAQFKIYNKLKKRYGRYIGEINPTTEGSFHRIVWLSWLQGIENAPDLVKKCYESVKENFSDWNIVVVTANNLHEYTEFPEYILEKWKSGVISNTHFSDLLRIELLTRHGGLWLDATVYCTGTLSAYIEKTDLFLHQVLKPGYTGHINRISSWMIWAKSNDPILTETKNLLWTYWKKEKKLFDYFLLHYFMTMTLNAYPMELQKIVPMDNAAPHILYLRLFEQYDENIWQSIQAQTPFHKLSYKFQQEQENIPGTYYDVLFGKQERNEL